MTRSVYLFGFIPLLTIHDDGEESPVEALGATESDEQGKAGPECQRCHSRPQIARDGSVTSETRESVGFVSEIPDDLPIQHRRETWE